MPLRQHCYFAYQHVSYKTTTPSSFQSLAVAPALLLWLVTLTLSVEPWPHWIREVSLWKESLILKPFDGVCKPQPQRIQFSVLVQRCARSLVLGCALTGNVRGAGVGSDPCWIFPSRDSGCVPEKAWYVCDYHDDYGRALGFTCQVHHWICQSTFYLVLCCCPAYLWECFWGVF